MTTWKETVGLAIVGAALWVMPAAADSLAAAPSRDGVQGIAQVIAQASTPAKPAPVPTAPAGQGTSEPAHGPADAHGADAHAADGEHHAGFPPFDATTFASQIFWLIISFGALYWLMSRVTLPRIGRILEERHDRIADDLEEAAKHKADSEAARASYEKALADARAKANTIAGETRNRLASETDANRKALEASLNAKLADAETRIAATKSEAMTHVRGIAVDAAHTIVTTLTGASPASGAVETAVDGALAAAKSH